MFLRNAGAAVIGWERCQSSRLGGAPIGRNLQVALGFRCKTAPGGWFPVSFEENSDTEESTSQFKKIKVSTMERRMSTTLTLLLLVTVLSGVGAVVVTIPQAVYEVARGKSVTLPCNIKPQGTPKQIIVTWSTVALTPDAQEDDVLTYYSNDRTTDFGSLYEGRASLDVDATTTNANLVLSSTTLDDNKKFQCQALIQGDLKGTPTAYTRLVVLVAPSTPTCMTQGKAEYGQNINLTCVSQEGSPPPVYTWKSQDVKNNPRAFPPRTTDQGGILSLFNISKETSGFFICTSTTQIGSASCNLTSQ
ncbi:hypothetical protein FQN60_000079 [Etheostoma spectabile]|uniref:Ig-like domain-containing protein n=1 Tax=Etheostoma spectabile TaxID=54343 RepID=A0A5J5CAN5_9PERO|nr:hypothetical protein FQN60_000079 [Etheostoma spectabile]